MAGGTGCCRCAGLADWHASKARRGLKIVGVHAGSASGKRSASEAYSRTSQAGHWRCGEVEELVGETAADFDGSAGLKLQVRDAGEA